MRLGESEVSLRSMTGAAGGRWSSAFAVALIAIVGCDSSDYEGPLEVGACEIRDAQKIPGDGAPLGFTATAAAERFPVLEHHLGFQGRGGWEPPESTDVEVGILSADLSRVYWVKDAHGYGASLISSQPPENIPDPCPPALTFPATVRFRTTDGMFDEELRVDVWAEAERLRWSTCVPAPRLRGRFQPPPAPEVWQSLVPQKFCFAGRAETGRLSGSVEVHYKDLRSPGSYGAMHYGYWSGQVPEPLDP